MYSFPIHMCVCVNKPGSRGGEGAVKLTSLLASPSIYSPPPYKRALPGGRFSDTLGQGALYPR